MGDVMLTQEQLKLVVSYDKDTGIFSKMDGTVIGSTFKNGYTYLLIGKKRYLAHRIAFLYETGRWPTEQIDHKNGVKNDNRWLNLREATPSQNEFNKGLRKDNSSGVKGVSWDKKLKSWKVSIQVSKKTIFLGRYKSFDVAKKIREEAESSYHGEYKKLGVG